MAKLGIKIDRAEVGEYVYKYRSFKDVNHLRLLLADELYFASPQDLNDPFDCAVDILWQNQPEEEIYDDVIKKAREIYPEFPARKQEEKARHAHRELLTMISNDAEGYAQEKQVAWEKAMGEEHSICSLSHSPVHPLMWSHYGDGHRGFCIGLNYINLMKWMQEMSGNLQDEIRPLRVQYVPEMETLDPGKHEASRIFAISVTHKHSDWAYEEETRLFCFGQGKHVRVLPEGVVSRVILGANMPATDRESILRMIKDRRGVETWEVVKHRGSYEMEMIPLAASENE